jgi:hypothetical protein
MDSKRIIERTNLEKVLVNGINYHLTKYELDELERQQDI